MQSRYQHSFFLFFYILDYNNSDVSRSVMVYSSATASSELLSEKACLAQTLFNHVTEGEIHLAKSGHLFIHVAGDLKLFIIKREIDTSRVQFISSQSRCLKQVIWIMPQSVYFFLLIMKITQKGKVTGRYLCSRYLKIHQMKSTQISEIIEQMKSTGISDCSRWQCITLSSVSRFSIKLVQP